MEEKLSKSFEIVDVAGPKAVQIRVAITGLEKSRFSTEASAEMEVLDSVSGKRLFAAVDRHSAAKITKAEGAKPYSGTTNYWSRIISNRLGTARAK